MHSSATPAAGNTITRAVYWHHLIADQSIFDDYADTIQQLVDGDLKSLGFEKLHSRGNARLYSIRCSRKSRLLLVPARMSSGERCMIIAEKLPNHEYHKSRLLNMPAPTLDEVWKGLANPRILSLVAIDAGSQAISQPEGELIPAEFYNNQWLALSDEQNGILQVQAPCVIGGAAGSGKTCVAFSLIVEASIQLHPNDPVERILYVTENRNLAEEIRKMWSAVCAANGIARHQVEILTYRDLCQAPTLGPPDIVGEQEFRTWINKHKSILASQWAISSPQLANQEKVAHGKGRKKNRRQTYFLCDNDLKDVYQEFRILSGYEEAEYRALGVDQSRFHTREDRDIICFLYRKYQTHLVQQEAMDLSFAACNRKGVYDKVVVDESQDFSLWQLRQLFECAKGGQVFFNLDPHQTLSDRFPKLHYLLHYLIRDDEGKRYHELPRSFRCPSAVIQFANTLLLAKFIATGGRLEKRDRIRIEEGNGEHHPDEGEVVWLTTRDEDIPSLNLPQGLVVMIFDERDREKAEALFPNSLVFAVGEYKGRQAHSVVLYRPLNQAAMHEEKVNVRLLEARTGNLAEKEIHLPRQGVVDSGLGLAFNAFYTAVTRAERGVIVIQPGDYKTAGVEVFLQEEGRTSKRLIHEEELAVVTAENWEAFYLELVEHGNLRQAKRLLKSYMPDDKAAESWLAAKREESKKPALPDNQTATTTQTSTSIGTPLPVVSLISPVPDNSQPIIVTETQKPAGQGVKRSRGKKKVSGPAKLSPSSAAIPGPSAGKVPARSIPYVEKLVYSASVGRLQSVKDWVGRGANINAEHKGTTALYIAAQNGHTAVVAFLLERKGINVNAAPEGLTALFIAARGGYVEIVRLLLSHGANIEMGYKDIRPLSIAIVHKHVEVAEELLSNGASIDHVDEEGATLLHLSIEYGLNKLTELLIEKGAKLDAVDHYGATPLHYAVQYRYIDICKLLLKKNASLEVATYLSVTPLHLAVENLDREFIELFLSEGANIETADQSGTPPLHVAVEKGDRDLIELLLNKGANLETADKEGVTALHIAIDYGRQDIVDYLLEKGANVEAKTTVGARPLHFAAQEGHLSICKALIEKGADIYAATIDDDPSQPIHFAAHKGHLDIIKLLVEKGADIHANSKPGITPFYLANARQHYHVTGWIKSKIVSLDDNGPASHSALLLQAAVSEDWERVNLLLDTSSAIQLDNSDEAFSVLHFAVYYQQTDIIRKLLKLPGVNIEVSTPDGKTPLIVAATAGYLEVVKILCENNCQLNQETMDGMNALILAAIHGHDEVVAWLLRQKNIHTHASTQGIFPLIVAMKHNQIKVTEILLNDPRFHSQVNLKNTEGVSLFCMVFGQGKWAIAKLLLNVKNLSIDEAQYRALKTLSLKYAENTEDYPIMCEVMKSVQALRQRKMLRPQNLFPPISPRSPTTDRGNTRRQAI